MFQLHILRDEVVLHSHPLGPQPVHIGRATTNDLVLSDPKISGRHLAIWTDAGSVWVEDLGSRNGTMLNGVAVQGRARADSGARLVLGERVHLRISGAMPAALGPRCLVLEDTTRGVRMPLRTDRFFLGADADCDLQIPAATQRAVLMLHGDEVWLGIDGDTHELTVGEPFTVAGQTLILRPDSGDLTRTEGLEQVAYPYGLDASVDRAVLTDLNSGRSLSITSEMRAALLYVLGRAWLGDAQSEPELRGWMHDDDVARGIWGKSRHEQSQNNYLVLVHRVRKSVADGGLDPWFLEKKRKHLRVRLSRVVIA